MVWILPGWKSPKIVFAWCSAIMALNDYPIGLVDSSILIFLTSPFPTLGVSGVLFFFHFYCISNKNSCKQNVKIRRRVLRRLIWTCTVCLFPFFSKVSNQTQINTYTAHLHNLGRVFVGNKCHEETLDSWFSVEWGCVDAQALLSPRWAHM